LKSFIFFVLFRLNYQTVINCKNLNDFFELNHSFIINANNFLEKLSSVLKKHIANDVLTEQEQKLLFHIEKHKDSKIKQINNNDFLKMIEQKNEEIRRYKALLEGIKKKIRVFIEKIEIIFYFSF